LKSPLTPSNEVNNQASATKIKTQRLSN